MLKLKNLKFLRNLLVGMYRFLYVKLFGMDIHPTANFSLSAKFDKTNPRGLHIGAYSYVAFDAAILTHDLTRGCKVHTYIGENCFVGARSIVLPGISVGNNSIIAAGAVVTKNVESGTIVAGNPARVIRSEIKVGHYGRLDGADQREDQDIKEMNF